MSGAYRVRAETLRTGDKTERFHMRLSESEAKRLDELAEMAGTSRSGVVRLMLGLDFPASPDEVSLREGGRQAAREVRSAAELLTKALRVLEAMSAP